jgi:hypothetical protein
MKQVLPQLKEILEWFKQQRLFRFYGSSLLFIYDGFTEGSAASFPPHIIVKMVDFAHTVKIRDGGKDDDYKFGIYTMVRLFENILSGNPPIQDVFS